MPDEKIDQKRPIDADNEPKPIQQRHVDDAVDDSFPASDPPAWTTSASKSVAAECEPEALNEVPTPPGEALKGGTGNNRVQSAVDQATGLAHGLYRRGQTYMEQGRRYLPEAERYYQQGTEAMRRPVQEHPLVGTVNLAPKRQRCRGRSRHASTHQPTRATPVASRQVRKARSRAARYSLAERR
jgi:hypothetical protein